MRYLKENADILVVALVVCGLLGTAFGLAQSMRGGQPRAPFRAVVTEAAQMAFSAAEPLLDRIDKADGDAVQAAEKQTTKK